MVKILAPRVRGASDPYIQDCLLVPLDKAHRTFPNVSGDMPPQTYWRYSRAERRVVSMVTVIDNGIHVAWDTCGGCTIGFKRCSCKGGFSAPGGIWSLAGGKPKREEAQSLPPRLALGERRPVQKPKEKRRFINFTPQISGRELQQLGSRLTLKRKKKVVPDIDMSNGFKKMKRRLR